MITFVVDYVLICRYFIELALSIMSLFSTTDTVADRRRKFGREALLERSLMR